MAKHGMANCEFVVEQMGRPSDSGCIRYCYTWAKAYEALDAFSIVYSEWWVECERHIDGRGWRANDVKWYRPRDDQLHLCGRLTVSSPGQFWAGHTGPKGLGGGKSSGKGKEAKGKGAKDAVGPSVGSGQIGSVQADVRGPIQTLNFDGAGNPSGPSASASSSSGQVVGPSASSSSDTAGPNVSLGQASQEDAVASAQGQDNSGPSAV